MQPIGLVISLSIFLVVVLASRQIGQFATRLNLPLITGYLLTGIIIGPFVLHLMETEQALSLRFIEQMSLAIIAFAAGAELVIKEIRGRFRSIGWNTAAQASITFAAGVAGIMLLANLIPFMRDMSQGEKLAVALLGSTILVARSPSSAIAIINELRAKGPFTQITLGVTVIKDVLIILLFALNVQIADVIFTGVGFNALFVIVIIGSLAASFGIGYGLNKVLEVMLASNMQYWQKIVTTLALGYGVFVISGMVRHWTHANLSFEVVLEPLIICMLASFTLINTSTQGRAFSALLHDIGPYIYVIFFTLVGAELRLDVLLDVWPIALALFAIRLVSLVVASFAGGILAADPRHLRYFSWMAYITQAGVGLGLAQEVSAEFPELGTSFATIMIATIVVSQLVGPPLMKWAIRHVGEAHEHGIPQPDYVRDAVILGREGVTLALGRRLIENGWQVTMIDLAGGSSPLHDMGDITYHVVKACTGVELSKVITPSTGAVVAMFANDADNLTACETAYEAGVPRLVVSVSDPAKRDAFKELGAWIVDRTTAYVRMLDQYVRSPQAQQLLEDPAQDMVQITLRDPAFHNVALKDVVLPNDVLCLSIERQDHHIVPHGYTQLKLGDEVTLVGSRESLDMVSVQMGF